MRSVELVVHCFQYSRVLAYSLSSLVINRPSRIFSVTVSVCFTFDDPATYEMISWFADRLTIRQVPYPLPELRNRSIGRNWVARHTAADVVIFSDADIVYGPGCLDSLADLPVDSNTTGFWPLYYPRVIHYNRTHENGDEYARRVTGPGIYGIDPADFIEHRPPRAVGNFQVIPGEVCRKVGYADMPEWQQPERRNRFHFGGDKIVRRVLGTQGKPVSIPSVYRIRQSTRGAVDSLPAASPVPDE